MKYKFGKEYKIEDVKKAIDKDGNFVAIITDICFNDIVCYDYDAGMPKTLNGIVEEIFEKGYRLQDLDYEIVGFNKEKQTVDISVNADASSYEGDDGEYDDEMEVFMTIYFK
jgi:hypothetical protein